MSIIEFVPSIIILLCALFPPANFWVRLLIVLLAFVLQAFVILAQDKAASMSSQNSVEHSRSYAQNYPD